ncbi:DNA polymerase III subunit delta [Candidatus Pelagibacter giovannonii]|uniref:DNA polymerase III subunit delta n=1 Tax=Candidatus Pelagibacter giovannonii TaxID=2563896 RepID=A0A6H1Q467_9PROT|nr:DNA polymerase III subunit delta [Candidatus Pelagibacter giovannonii]QIZ21045.1 DNA polymerase III subunit delta [Candidatus Pelagibacter giovannonii]
MILKSFELTKVKLNNYKFYLFYGDNEGLKEENIKNLFEKNYHDKIHRYDEKEILDDLNIFFNSVLTKSFFDNQKLIIINRATDKISKIIEDLMEKNPEDIQIIINSKNLEKKSTLRKLFEKEKAIVCVPFYEDNNQTLNSIVNLFFRNKKIPVSQQLINILIERSKGDRKNLNNELDKIETYSLNKKNLNIEEIIKLTNLADNYSASELVDHSLAKNTRKTVTILSENNYSDDDNIIIIRTLLAKLKRLVKIYELIDKKNNIEQAISACKPPIFWKDKSLVTQQIKSWEKDHLINLIYKTNEIELLVKKNSVPAKNILADFIINNSKKTSN